MKPSIGRIVQVKVGFKRPDGHAYQEWKPALVTAVFSEDMVNATVFLDGLNDRHIDLHSVGSNEGDPEYLPGVFARVYSRNQGDDLGDWRWPPRV